MFLKSLTTFLFFTIVTSDANKLLLVVESAQQSLAPKFVQGQYYKIILAITDRSIKRSQRTTTLGGKYHCIAPALLVWITPNKKIYCICV